MKRVALIGPSDRDELLRLQIRLEERAAEGVILDSRSEPAIELTAGREQACGIDLSDFSAVYVTDLGLPRPVVLGDDGEPDLAASLQAAAHSRRHMVAWIALLNRMALRCRVINLPQTYALHDLKPWEMSVYRDQKLPAPLTVATSDPKTLTSLPAEVSDGWICKGMTGGYGYTEQFQPPASRDQAVAQLDSRPLMVQERIEGDNVRAFVVGGVMIGAAEVIPTESEEVDSRRGSKRIRRVELPEPARQASVAAAARWGLSFTAVDLMREARSREYQILECNSAPFFVNFEKATGIEVSARLADLLIGRRIRTS